MTERKTGNFADWFYRTPIESESAEPKFEDVVQVSDAPRKATTTTNSFDPDSCNLERHWIPVIGYRLVDKASVYSINPAGKLIRETWYKSGSTTYHQKVYPILDEE